MTARESGDPGTIKCGVCNASIIMAYDENKPGRPLVYFDVDNAQINSMGKPHAHQPKTREATAAESK